MPDTGGNMWRNQMEEIKKRGQSHSSVASASDLLTMKGKAGSIALDLLDNSSVSLTTVIFVDDGMCQHCPIPYAVTFMPGPRFTLCLNRALQSSIMRVGAASPL